MVKPADNVSTAPRASSPFPDVGRMLDEVRAMRILLVDARQGSAVLLKNALLQGGFEHLDYAANGAEALTALRASLQRDAEPLGALLLSAELPDMDSLELARLVRAYEEWAGIPLLLVCEGQRWDEVLLREAYAAGVTDLLYKPVRAVELWPRLINALCLRREWALRRQREQQLESELAEGRVLEARLEYLVGHDDLTGLANRRTLEHALGLTLRDASDFQRHAALIYVDLDQFKLINNSEGHHAGDQLLIHTAGLLRGFGRSADTLARVGGDHFTLLLGDCSLETAQQQAERLRAALACERFIWRGKPYPLSASIGLAWITGGCAGGAGELLSRGEQACYAAKRAGGNRVKLYSRDDSSVQLLSSSAHWVPLIRDAVDQGRFRLVFQPMMRLSDGSVPRYEALLRMVDEQGAVLPSMEFIGIAEQTGLIGELDRWVIEQACATLAAAPASLSLNVNLSGQVLEDPHLLTHVREQLRRSGLDASRITFEITETAAVANFARTRKRVRQLRALGCRFALDDFGSGFSTYQYLKEFPVDMLKVDGAFITGLAHDHVDQTLVRSMLDIARTLGKETVAEYVTCARSYALVRRSGFDYGQGYHIGHPQEDLE
jgi:diguanylate cyclase (GGDEF)-like protein